MGEAAETQFQRPQGDILSHLIFIHIWVLIAFFSHFSSTRHLPSSLTGRSILCLIQNPFLLIPILQKCQRPLVTCWFFSCWLICWPCCRLLPFYLVFFFFFFFGLFPNLGQNLQPAVFSHLHYHYLQTESSQNGFFYQPGAL